MNCRKESLRLLIVLLLPLASCEKVPVALQPLQQPSKLETAPPRVSSTIQTDHTSQRVFEAPGQAAASATSSATPANQGVAGDVTLNFVDTDIREVTRTILGTTLNLNYTIDPNVHGTATLEASTPMGRSALLRALETMLNQNGATLVVRDGIYAVMPIAMGSGTSGPASADTLGAGTQVIVLRYAVAKELAKTLEPFVAESGKITADPNRNAVVISGSPPVRQTLIGLIKAFDIDLLAGQSFALFPVGDADVGKTAEALERAIRAESDGPLSGIVRVIPMERANAVLVSSSQPRYLDAAKRLFSLTNRAEEATVRTWHVYYVKNGQSADLEALLQRAFTPGHVSPSAAPPGSTPAGAQTANMSGFRNGLGTATGPASSSGQTGTTGGGLGSTLVSGAPGTVQPPDTSLPAARALGPAGQGDESTGENRIRIIANRHNNALLIYATPPEYSVIEGMLRKIDIVPLQVMIEASIAEVTLNDQLNYGTQFFLGGKVSGVLTQASPSTSGGQVGTVIGQPFGYANNFPGFVLSNGIRETINALSAVTKVKVLSAPQVMVLDNEPARLQVGSLVPILTQSQQSTAAANAPIVNNIDYRDTGVIMLVTPQVNSDGLVTLDISQEVSDVAQLTTGNIDSPTFDQRLIRTRVAVQDGQTVGMAGLIQDSDSQGNSGIPFLKDVPVLGSLFSSQQNNRQRTELLVLITPHVVHDQRDAYALTEDLRSQLKNAGTVPQALKQRRPSGSANPNGL